MNLNELQHNIEQARTSKNDGPPLKFCDMRSLLEARSAEDKNILTFYNGKEEHISITYAEVCGYVFGCARFLQNRGLSRGDSVATISHNHWHTLVQYYACWLLGLVVVPINLEARDERIAGMLDKAKVELAFIHIEYRKRFRNITKHNDQFKHIEWIVCDGEIKHFIRSEGEVWVDDKKHPEAFAMLAFNEDQSGSSKGVLLTHRNLLESAQAFSKSIPIGADTTLACTHAFHHIDGIMGSLVVPFYSGGTALLTEHNDLHTFAADIRKEGTHIVSTTPELLEYMDSEYEEEKYPELSSLQQLICNGDTLSPAMIKDFEEQFGIAVICGYSSWETTGYVCLLPADLTKSERQKWLTGYEQSSIGGAVSPNEMSVHNGNGQPLGEN